MKVWAATGYTTLITLFRIDGNLNTDREISDILCSVVVPYFRGLTNATFKQDNARPHVARHVLNFFNIQGIRLLTWSAQFHNLSPIENICSWVPKRLARYLFQANTVDEVSHTLEAVRNELPFFVIQAQFDSSMHKCPINALYV